MYIDVCQNLVSIVVPIFNAETWLPRCISSLINQTYKNLEIILIDDGSNDNSYNICEFFAKSDSRIKIFRKENGGVSAARNFGIEKSNGKFLIFVDSDDYIKNDIVEKALLNLKSEHNLCMRNYILFNNVAKKEGPFLYLNKCSHKEMLLATLSRFNFPKKYNLGAYFRTVWGKIFNLDIIKKFNITFNTDLYIGEDAIFLCKYLNYIKSIDIINEYGYFYRISENSAVMKYKEDLYHQSILQKAYFENELKYLRNDKSYNECMLLFIWQVFNCLVLNDSLCKKNDFHDSKMWFAENKRLMRKIVFLKGNSKFNLLQQIFSFLPFNLQAKLIIAKYKSKRIFLKDKTK